MKKRLQRNMGGKATKSTEQGFFERLFKGQPDPFKPGVMVNIDGAKLRVLAADKETVTLCNAAGMPIRWEREWLEALPTSSIYFPK